MSSVFPVAGKEKRSRGVVGSPAPVLFPTAVNIQNGRENTLRTKFREMLSLAAVSGMLPGGCTCIHRCGHHPLGSTPRAWGGWGITVVSFSYGEAEARQRKTFYIKSWGGFAVQPSAPLLFSISVKRDVNVKVQCWCQDNNSFYGRSHWLIVNHYWPWTNINPEFWLLTYTFHTRENDLIFGFQ